MTIGTVHGGEPYSGRRSDRLHHAACRVAKASPGPGKWAATQSASKGIKTSQPNGPEFVEKHAIMASTRLQVRNNRDNHADPGVRTDPKSLIRESCGEAHSQTWSRPTAGSPPSGLRRHRLPARPKRVRPAVACGSPALAAPPFTSPARGAGRTIVPVFAGPPRSSRPSWKPTGRPRIQG